MITSRPSKNAPGSIISRTPAEGRNSEPNKTFMIGLAVTAIKITDGRRMAFIVLRTLGVRSLESPLATRGKRIPPRTDGIIIKSSEICWATENRPASEIPLK